MFQYHFPASSSNVFQVDNTTGIISNAKRLDYDGTEHERGVPYDICIRVSVLFISILFPFPLGFGLESIGNEILKTCGVNISIWA